MKIYEQLFKDSFIEISEYNAGQTTGRVKHSTNTQLLSVSHQVHNEASEEYIRVANLRTTSATAPLQLGLYVPQHLLDHITTAYMEIDAGTFIMDHVQLPRLQLLHVPISSTIFLLQTAGVEPTNDLVLAKSLRYAQVPRTSGSGAQDGGYGHALHAASRYGHAKVVQILLDAGAESQ